MYFNYEIKCGISFLCHVVNIYYANFVMTTCTFQWLHVHVLTYIVHDHMKSILYFR